VVNLAKKKFKAESKRLLDLMINSVYTHKEIFLRELISNASDAIDKIYYKALTDESIGFDRNDYYIRVEIDRDNRLLKVSDTGIGMTKEELEDNLGVIARSGSLTFKQENEMKEGVDIIGQFGVGFYSAFMVAERVTVISRAFGAEGAFKWESDGSDGYTVTPCEKDGVGTDVMLRIKQSAGEENYDEFLEEHRIRAIIKKYSDFVRYPIRMNVTTSRPKEGEEDGYETVVEEQTVNSMVPIWRKNKNELSEDDYENFYSEKRYGFDKPLRHIHISVDGAVRYNAILFIPQHIPFDYYTKEYEKGLELYSNGVLIMQKCPELLPDHFSFVKGMVDSEDLSLNISREMLQHDRQLRLIAKNVRHKIKNELASMLEKDRETYEKFFEAFGRQLKFGVYAEFGSNKEELRDLLLFRSSAKEKPVTLKEYVLRMQEGQKYIYYAAGESVDRISKMPQTELVAEKGYEILYFTEDVDEFAIKMLSDYDGKEFRSVSGRDLGIETEEKPEKDGDDEEIFEKMKEILADRVKDVRASARLRHHPVCLTNEGELSIEMEKVLGAMPDGQRVKAEKVLEINTEHEMFETLKDAFKNDGEKFRLYTGLLYGQALLIEGLPLEDPVEFANGICRLMTG
jgi:molecular chaperone HtpG